MEDRFKLVTKMHSLLHPLVTTTFGIRGTQKLGGFLHRLRRRQPPPEEREDGGPPRWRTDLPLVANERRKKKRGFFPLLFSDPKSDRADSSSLSSVLGDRRRRQRFLLEWKGEGVTHSESPQKSFPPFFSRFPFPIRPFRVLGVGVEGREEEDGWSFASDKGFFTSRAAFLCAPRISPTF